MWPRLRVRSSVLSAAHITYSHSVSMQGNSWMNVHLPAEQQSLSDDIWPKSRTGLLTGEGSKEPPPAGFFSELQNILSPSHPLETPSSSPCLSVTVSLWLSVQAQDLSTHDFPFQRETGGTFKPEKHWMRSSMSAENPQKMYFGRCFPPNKDPFHYMQASV